MTQKETAFTEVFAEKEKRRADRLAKAKKIIAAFSNGLHTEKLLFSMEDGHFLRMQETQTVKCSTDELYKVIDRVGDKKQTGSLTISQNPDGSMQVVKVRYFKL